MPLSGIPFLEIISLALVFMWTMRLARSKGRNPWAWCGAALAPVLLTMATGNGSWQLISMVPMVALLFMKAPRPQRGPGPAGITCPRCEADHPHGRYYCTSCGWELTKAYPAEGVIAEETPRIATLTESLETGGAGAPPTEAIGTASAHVESTQTDEPPVIESEAKPTVEEEPLPLDVQPEAPPAEEPPAEKPAPVPVRPLAPLVIPTAVSLTNRGIERFNEGKLQESIDQFTKALAMDSNHAEAWERRAEAYTQLGRNDEADEDRRRLAAINPA